MSDYKLKAKLDQAIKDAEAYIDARAATVKESCPGVPLASIRQSIIGNFAGCPCKTVLNLMEKDK